MNLLINVPVLSATMRTLGREMEKAGFIQVVHLVLCLCICVLTHVSVRRAGDDG